MPIILNEEFHRYQDTETGRIIPDSTTGLLRKLGFMEDSHYYTQYGRDRGSLAHEVARMHLAGTLDEESVDSVLVPYYHAVLRFLADTGFIFTRTEFIVYSETWDYASKIDGEGYYPNEPHALYLVDWKTGQMQEWVKYQLSLEKIALGQHRGRLGVNLKGNGQYKARRFNNKYDEYEVLERLRKYKEEPCKQEQSTMQS